MDALKELIKAADLGEAFDNSKTAKVVVESNRVLHKTPVPGLNVKTEEQKYGISMTITTDENAIIENPVHLCFGVLHKSTDQKIILKIDIAKNSKISIYGHCIFIGKDIMSHEMDARIMIHPDASYTYFERHVHPDDIKIKVIPKAKVTVESGARFETGFELLKGRVGDLEIDYEIVAKDDAVCEMEARVSAKKDDKVIIRENATLSGKNSRGVLKSRVAVRDEAKAEVFNRMKATSEGAIGHVDCREILKDSGTVKAYPEVEVTHPKARVTHEASLGGVNNRELETLMARGLTEKQAEDIIIKGLLS